MGAMNQFLAAAPESQVVHGGLACVSRSTTSPIGRRGRWRRRSSRHRRSPASFLPDTARAAQLGERPVFDETTRTLLAGDLFTQVGGGVALTSDDMIEASLTAEQIFHFTSLGPNVVRPCAARGHGAHDARHDAGPSYQGDGAAQLTALASGYARVVADDAA